MTSAAELRAWLVEQVARRCYLDEAEIDPGVALDEYGLSSRDAVELAGDLEELLGRGLPTTLLWDHPDIDRLTEALLAEAAPEPGAVPPPPESPGDAIAVIGLGCRLPGGVHGPDELWRLLAEGRDAIGEVPQDRWRDYGTVPEKITRRGGFLDDIAGFDAEFFGIAPREAARMDPQQRLVLEVAWEALEHAGIAPSSLRGSPTGVFVGISGTEYGARSLADVSTVDAWTGTGAALAVAANRLSYVLDLRGPSLAVDTACSSSLTAVHLAVQSLRSGESGLALVGGANLLLGPGITAGFDEMGISSAEGRCKPFSAGADGIVRAEGAGVVVLKPLARARADGDRILAVIRGSATNSDGRSNGLTAPNAEAQQALLRTAYRGAGIDPATVDYVEAHGTGTLLGDPIEARALGAVLGRGRTRPLLVGSVKGNLGHLEAAAGIAGLIKTVLALRHGLVPATAHYTEANPHIPFDELKLSVVDSARPWPETGRPVVAGVSGFGFGGTNTHVVLEQAPPPAEPAEEPAIERFLLGAASDERLREAAGLLARWLARTPGIPLADVARTLARRLDGRRRAAVVARTRDELLEGLAALEPVAGPPSGKGPVFVFSGHGGQWAGMGRRLLAEEPVFAAAVDRLDPLLAAETGRSLAEDLRAGAEATTMDRVQPMLFGLQLALAELWAHYGVRPAAVIGHSVGEVAAAVVAGALTEADGARIVALRSKLLASLAGDGAMALLEADAAEAAELLDGVPDVDVAALSAPRQTVIAGRADAVRRIVSQLDARGRLARLVKLDVAAHSPVVDRVTGTLAGGLAGLVPALPALPFYSTTLDDPRQVTAFGAAYWAANLRRPVRFSAAVAAAADDGHHLFVELSPHPVLRHALADNLDGRGALVLSSLREGPDETAHFHRQLAALELAGAARPARSGRLADLPGTRWHHTRHWLPATPPATTGHPLLGVHAELPEGGKHLWQADLGTEAQPWLADLRLDGRPVLPLSTYLEMALTAARTAFDTPPERIVLDAVTPHRPLVLSEHTPVTTTLTPRAGGGTVEVHGKDEGGAWHRTATVEFSLTEPTATGTFSSTVDERGTTAVSALHRRFAGFGVVYGPAFTGLREPRTAVQPGRVVATVALPGAAPGDPRFFLHPSVVESCLQAFAAALPEPEPGRLHLPVRFGTVRGTGRVSGGETVHVSVAEDARGGWTGELHVVDATGRVLLEIGEVSLREAARAEIAAPLAERLLEAVWHPAPLDSPRSAGESGGDVVVLGEQPSPLATALRARQAGFGAGFDPQAEAVLVVVPPRGSLADAERAVLAVADATRRLADLARPPRLLLVTTGAFSVEPGEVAEPAFASLRGLVRVLACEHPELRPAITDLDPGWTPEEAAAALADELATGDDDEVAWRAGVRYARRLDWLPQAAAGTAPVVRPGAAYVLSGGLGGLGRHLAAWLAEQGAGKVVLNGRSAPGPAAREALAALPAGTEVEVVLGDIAEPGVAERLVAAAGPALRGVIHAAAVLDDRTTSRLDAETLHRSWRPKAYGAWRLHEVTRDLDLDWWVGFSSAAALHGSPGQPSYASANAYLDALVATRRAQGLPATSISWGTWAEIGAAADLDIPWLHPIRPEEGTAVLAAVLGRDLPHAGALRLDVPRLVTAFPQLTGLPFFASLLGEFAPQDEEGPQWTGIGGLNGLPPDTARATASAQLRA
ncbi:acyltransferase domain-containing protein, partial [Amycolatopsis rhizosphaerae]